MSDYNRVDIRNALERLPLHKGDVVFIHSNLGFFGRCDGVTSGNELCEIFFDEIVRVIGHEGTIVVPTFTYSFQVGNDFDVATSESAMGIFAEWIRSHNDSIRSFDPCYSVAAIGTDSHIITSFAPENSFDYFASVFARFAGANAQVLNFNFDAGSTFIHFAERCNNVPYRYDKQFSGNVIWNGNKIPHKNIIYVHYRHPLLSAEFEAFHNLAMKHAMFHIQNLGRGQMGVISIADTYNLVTETLKTDPWFLTKAGKVGEIPDMEAIKADASAL